MTAAREAFEQEFGRFAGFRRGLQVDALRSRMVAALEKRFDAKLRA